MVLTVNLDFVDRESSGNGRLTSVMTPAFLGAYCYVSDLRNHCHQPKKRYLVPPSLHCVSDCL